MLTPAQNNKAKVVSFETELFLLLIFFLSLGRRSWCLHACLDAVLLPVLVMPTPFGDSKQRQWTAAGRCQRRNQFWQSVEGGAGKRCLECGSQQSVEGGAGKRCLECGSQQSVERGAGKRCLECGSQTWCLQGRRHYNAFCRHRHVSQWPPLLGLTLTLTLAS